MPTKIHFICRDQLGLRCIDPKAHIYTSREWLLSPEEAAAMVGGVVHFHQVKTKPSYFGGVIQSLAPVAAAGEEITPGRARYELPLKSTLEAKGVAWDKRGHSHGMAWTTGVIHHND